MSSKNSQQTRERPAPERAGEARRRHRRLWLAGISAATVVAIAAAGGTLAFTGGSAHASGGAPQPALASLSALGTLAPAPPPGPEGPEDVAIPNGAPLAGPAAGTAGQVIDGISCQSGEKTLFHIHAHLTIFVKGSPRQVPAGIGIPGARAQSTPRGPFITAGKCFYWLHTHVADGVIHIESPVQRTYTLGEFFDEWGQPLGPGQAGPATGHVTAYYNGRPYHGNPRNIPLTAHAQIQLDVGTPLVAPVSITWPPGL
jgi:hypothetical protein